MLKKIALPLLAVLAAGSEAQADGYCFNESINYLIVKGDDIFFTTNKSCLNWCKIDPTWSADAKKRSYAALLAAKTSGGTIALHFYELTSTCSGPVATYAAPSTIITE